MGWMCCSFSMRAIVAHSACPHAHAAQLRTACCATALHAHSSRLAFAPLVRPRPPAPLVRSPGPRPWLRPSGPWPSGLRPPGSAHPASDRPVPNRPAPAHPTPSRPAPDRPALVHPIAGRPTNARFRPSDPGRPAPPVQLLAAFLFRKAGDFPELVKIGASRGNGASFFPHEKT